MIINDITTYLETKAPLSLQESYDNAGLLTGCKTWECTGIITTLDATEAVVLEAIENKCNLIIAHHPIIFGGLKTITGKNYIEKTIIKAIKNDIAIYAIHTNLDNVLPGVNGKIAEKLGLINCKILQPKKGTLKKIITYVPIEQLEEVRTAIFNAGAGEVGNYSECSFSVGGKGTFKANENAKPYVGEIGQMHTENEIKIEVIFPAWIENEVVKSLLCAHPYEVVAYDVITLDNTNLQVGSGVVGEMEKPISEIDFMNLLKKTFGLTVIRHTKTVGKMVKKIALCGGSGSFLIPAAIAAGADFYVTGDVKYHEFFDANEQLVIADIGHYESEQFTIDLLFDILSKKFPNFAILKTGIKTNPVQYF